MLGRLLEEGISDEPDENGATALIAASGYGLGEVVEKLLEKGASIDMQPKQGATALMSASARPYGGDEQAAGEGLEHGRARKAWMDDADGC
jgi:hypothetical protein